MKINITIIFWFSFVFNLFAWSFGFLGDSIPLEKSSVINKVSNYSFYKEKFDINNSEHLRIMNEPTQDELNAFAANIEAAGKDGQLNLQLDDLLNHAILIYDNAINSASLKNERDFFDFRNKLLQILRNGNQISATSFDPVNGFAGGPINSCLSDHPAIKLHKRVFEMIHNIKTKIFWVTIKNRNESSGTLSANIQSMYTTSNFVTSVNTLINGDPDMPQDLVASQVRFETVASSVPSWMSNPSNPLDNVVDLRTELETNGIWWGVNADVFHFVAKSNILWTGTSVNELWVIWGCSDVVPNVWVHVWSSSNLPIITVIGHELTHGIAEVNHTNTPDDIANNEIMRPVVNTISNYRNQTFTIDPFWALVNQSEDCLNAAPPLPVALTAFNAIVENCNSCPLGQAVKLLWRTESETNNAGFEVELSRDGIHFSSIGFVPSLSSNSVSSHSYDFGVLSLVQGGTYYFRLKILAKDGSLPTFSDINSVYLVDHAAIPVLLQNPCYANASFGISNLFVGDKVSIYCYNGTLLQEYSIDLDAIDPLSFLAPAQPGLFIVKVARLDAIYSFKLSVIK